MKFQIIYNTILVCVRQAVEVCVCVLCIGRIVVMLRISNGLATRR